MQGRRDRGKKESVFFFFFFFSGFQVGFRLRGRRTGGFEWGNVCGFKEWGV